MITRFDNLYVWVDVIACDLACFLVQIICLRMFPCLVTCVLSTLCGEVGPPAFAVKKLYRIIALVEETKYGLEQYRYIHRVVGQ